MPAFEYVAINNKGKEEKGVLDADTARQARQLLRDGGKTPLEVSQLESSESSGASGDGKIKKSRTRMGPAELSLVTRQLSTLLQAGAPLEEALATSAKQTDKNSVKRIMSSVRSRVNEGVPLAASMEAFPSAFPKLYTATVEAGQESGHLEAVLDRLADYTESRQAMQQKVSTAMYYPIILIIMAIGIVAGLLAYVVPKVVKVFQDMDAELPPLTNAVLWVSDFIVNYGIHMVIVMAVIVFFITRLLRIRSWQYRFHRLLLKLPLVGKMIRGFNTARFARTLSILSSSGVDILQALGISSRVIQNLPMRDAVDAATIKIREGTPIYKALESSGYFPPMTVYMIASGENSGKLDEMLERAADQQERETDTTLTSLLSLFEPALIVIMGGIVMLIVMAILLPIFNMNSLLGQ